MARAMYVLASTMVLFAAVLGEENSCLESSGNCQDITGLLQNKVMVQDVELHTNKQSKDPIEQVASQPEDVPKPPVIPPGPVPGDHSPHFTAETMPAVSTTLKCIMNMTYQYFLVYTLLAIVRTLNSFNINTAGTVRILEAAATTVTYAPMLCVLFLGCRLRAMQLTQGETEQFELPQKWAQRAMEAASGAVAAQATLVLIIGLKSGLNNVATDAEGHLDTSKMGDENPITLSVLTAVRYLILLGLWGGAAVVVGGILAMQGPKEIWGDKQPPVSPAVACTILLTGVFFLIYFIVAITRTLFELMPSMRESSILLKLEASAGAAKMTVNLVPMLAVLFIGARMRALQIDPLNGSPQSWAQKCFYMCTFSILAQAVLALLLPIVTGAEVKRGNCEGDVSFAMENAWLGAVLTAARYVCLLALYAGIIAVVYSIVTIQHPQGPLMTPPVSPAMKCVISLAFQYFFIYSALFILVTIKSFVLPFGIAEESSIAVSITKAISIIDAGRATVMFAPMLSVLFIGTRLRALQLAKNQTGTVPVNAGPQLWAQQAMQLATGAILVQLIMTMIVSVLTGNSNPEHDVDGNIKMPADSNKYLAIIAEIIRYLTLVCMYVGAVIVCVGVVKMTPETVQPYAVQGLPGLSSLPGLKVD